MQRQRSIPKEDAKTLPLQFTFSKIRRSLSFHVAALQVMGKQCTKIQNVRAQPVYLMVNLLFGDVFVRFPPSWFAKAPY